MAHVISVFIGRFSSFCDLSFRESVRQQRDDELQPQFDLCGCIGWLLSGSGWNGLWHALATRMALKANEPKAWGLKVYKRLVISGLSGKAVAQSRAAKPSAKRIVTLDGAQAYTH
jgi:hypothetical protein